MSRLVVNGEMLCWAEVSRNLAGRAGLGRVRHGSIGALMLRNVDVIAFVPTRDPERARRFYEQTLGLAFVSEDPFALLFNAHGVTLRIVNVSSVADFKPQPFTILGWRVASAERAVRELGDKGVQFERFPGMDQDRLGIWQSPSGAKVAWFKDADGNVLSVTEN